MSDFKIKTTKTENKEHNSVFKKLSLKVAIKPTIIGMWNWVKICFDPYSVNFVLCSETNKVCIYWKNKHISWNR